MTEQFKTTAEYRHWMARHDLEDYQSTEIYELIRDTLPPLERDHWSRVDAAYRHRDFPAWFIKEVGELNDY
jgi:hypothetical protein